jgi:hypothetical protein
VVAEAVVAEAQAEAQAEASVSVLVLVLGPSCRGQLQSFPVAHHHPSEAVAEAGVVTLAVY